MLKEFRKMVTWIDLEHDPNRTPLPNMPILMIVDYEICIGYYDLEYGFQQLPIECRLSNHFNAKNVVPAFWAYMPKHPFSI